MIRKAIDFANEKHKNQKRKGSNIPYIFHLIDTANIIAQVKNDEELITAAILHDSVEDAGVSLEEIRNIFGARVAELVEGVSEPDKSKPWKQRKQHTINHLRDESTYDIQLLECADKLSNIRSIYIDMQIIGDKIWDKFNADYNKQKWYYIELVKSLKNLGENFIYIQFCEMVNKVFNIKE